MFKLLKGLLVNSFYLYLIQGLNYLLPLLVLPYLLGVLNSHSFGIFAYSQSFIQFLILIVDFGFNLSITKRIAALPKDSKEIDELFWLIFFIKLCIFIALCAVVVIAFYCIPSIFIYRTAVFWSLLTLLGTILFPIYIFQGLEQIKIMSFINALAKLLTFPFIFVWVKAETDYMPAVFLHTASYVVGGVIALAFFLSQKRFRSIPTTIFKRNKVLDQVRYAWPVFLSNSSISLYTSSLTIILGFYATTSQVGFFGAVERIVRVVCFGVYVPINQAAFPMLARLASVDMQQAKRLFKVIFYTLCAVMITISLLFLAFDTYVINKFFSNFTNIELLLGISIFTIIPIALGGTCGQLGLLALGDDVHKRVFTRVYSIVGVLSLPVSFIAIYLFKVEGAVFAMMITELVIFGAMFNYVLKYKFL